MADLSGVSSTGLELHLEFDGDTTDTSANSRDQTPEIGALTYASDGAVGQAAKFRYSSQNHIDTGVNALGSADLFCDSGSSDFTVATFIRFSGDSAFGAGTICARQEGTGAAGIATSNFFLHVHSDRRLLVRLRGQDNVYSVQMHDGEWHQVAVTWDGSAAKVYFDGALLGTASVGSVAENAVNIFIGGSSLPDIPGLPTSNLVGQLDDFRIYSRALSSTEIRALWGYGAPSGSFDCGSAPVGPFDNLELWLEFEEDTDDSSGRSADQTVTGGTLSYVAPRVNCFAAEFDDAAYMDTGASAVGDATLFADSGQSWSVSFWADFAADNHVQTVIGKVQSGILPICVLELEDSGTNTILFQTNLRNSSTSYDTGLAVSSGYHHYALTWDGSTARMYVDGEFAQNANVGTGSDHSGTNVLIGGAQISSGGAGLFFSSVLDDLRIYSDQLTADEISALAGAAASTFSVALSVASITSGGVATVSVTFGHSVNTFVAGDVTATNATIGTPTGSGTSWSFTATPAADGTVTVSIAAGAVQDADGLDNRASNTLSFGVGSVADPSGAGLLRFDRTVAPTHTASVLIGPIPISPNSLERSIIQRARVILGSGTDATGSFLISCGVDAEDAVTRAENDAHQYSTTIAAVGNNAGLVIPRVGGSAAVFEITVSSGHLTLEGIDVQLEPKGRNRAGRYSA